MRINLVLGSGGARGFAHIGVIHELQDRGHEIVGISGTSMGSLIGGVLAAGTLDEFYAEVRQLSPSDLRRLADWTLGAPGLIRLQRVMNELHNFLGDTRIEDLPIPYAAVATDIESLREVWFNSGPLIAAIRASIAIPAVFTPVRIGGRLLVDGGLLNPLPTGPAMSMPGDVSVGVSLFGKPPGLHLNAPREQSSDSTEADGQPSELDPAQHPWTSRLSQSLSQSWVGRQVFGLLQHPEPEVKDFEDMPADVNMMDLLGRTLDVMQGRIEVARTMMNAPDVLVWVPMDSCGVLDFHRAEEMVDYGRKLAIEELTAWDCEARESASVGIRTARAGSSTTRCGEKEQHDRPARQRLPKRHGLRPPAVRSRHRRTHPGQRQLPNHLVDR